MSTDVYLDTKKLGIISKIVTWKMQKVTSYSELQVIS